MKTPVNAQPVIVCVAPNGARKSKREHPMLPLSADEIALEASACMEAGASMLHLHVRDERGGHSLDGTLYAKAIDAVRRRCGAGLLIQCTTEAAGCYDWASQFQAIRDIRHDYLSISLREAAGGHGESPQRPGATHRDPPRARTPPRACPPEEERRLDEVFDYLQRTGIAVQLILYDADDLPRLRLVLERFPDHALSVLYVLGGHGETREPAPRDLDPRIESADHRLPWMVCAFGRREHDCMSRAATLGGHVRVGFENSLLRADGTAFDRNAESVRLLVERLTDNGHAIADAAHAAAIFTSRNAIPP